MLALAASKCWMHRALTLQRHVTINVADLAQRKLIYATAKTCFGFKHLEYLRYLWTRARATQKVK